MASISIDRLHAEASRRKTPVKHRRFRDLVKAVVRKDGVEKTTAPERGRVLEAIKDGGGPSPRWRRIRKRKRTIPLEDALNLTNFAAKIDRPIGFKPKNPGPWQYEYPVNYGEAMGRNNIADNWDWDVIVPGVVKPRRKIIVERIVAYITDRKGNHKLIGKPKGVDYHEDLFWSQVKAYLDKRRKLDPEAKIVKVAKEQAKQQRDVVPAVGRAVGAGALAGGAVAGAEHAARKGFLNPKFHEFIRKGLTASKGEESAWDDPVGRSIRKEVESRGVRVRSSNANYYSPGSGIWSSDHIGLRRDAPVAAIAHEAGHATNPNKFSKVMQNLALRSNQRGGITSRLPSRPVRAVGALTGAGTAMTSDDEDKKVMTRAGQAAVTVPALAKNAPLLHEEGRANVHAMKKLKSHGGWKYFRHGLKKLPFSYGSYLSVMAPTAAAVGGLEAIYRLTKSKNAKRKGEMQKSAGAEWDSAVYPRSAPVVVDSKAELSESEELRRRHSGKNPFRDKASTTGPFSPALDHKHTWRPDAEEPGD